MYEFVKGNKPNEPGLYCVLLDDNGYGLYDQLIYWLGNRWAYRDRHAGHCDVGLLPDEIIREEPEQWAKWFFSYEPVYPGEDPEERIKYYFGPIRMPE